MFSSENGEVENKVVKPRGEQQSAGRVLLGFRGPSVGSAGGREGGHRGAACTQCVAMTHVCWVNKKNT